MKKTTIIIPNYNGLDVLQACVESIRTHTSTEYELIVVDDGSIDGSADWCRNNEVIFISLPANIGFPAACNFGLKIASGDAILLLNNDTLVTENWLTNLLSCLYSNEEIGIVGPVTNYASGKQQINIPYTNLQEISEKINKPDQAKWKQTKRIVGLCLLMKREVLERVGLLDERFSPGHFEDDDYCYRANMAGYKLMIAGDVFVYHHGSATFNKQSEGVVKDLIETNRSKFIEKWGVDPSSLYSE